MFDFHFNPKIPRSKIIDLATCGFVERKENVLLVGRAGVGKSHIAQALGQRACRAGYDMIDVSASSLDYSSGGTVARWDWMKTGDLCRHGEVDHLPSTDRSL